MPNIPVRQLGALGIIQDVDPFDLPGNALSDGMNVRFNNNRVERAPIHRTFFDSLTGTTPAWLFGTYNLNSYDTVLYANSDGKLYQIANGTETDVSESGHSAHTTDAPYTGFEFAQVVYLNRNDAVPRALLPGTSSFVTLAHWDSTWRCEALRGFGSYLVAINVTKSSTNYPNLFKWSDTAPNGGVPTTWDATDTAHLAGENPISWVSTPLVDGAPLGEDFIVYSKDGATRVTKAGYPDVFNFQRLPFVNAGLINQNCVLEIDGNHYVWGPNDIYKHDGTTATSLMDGRNRETFFGMLNQNASKAFFVAHDRARREIIFCGVVGHPHSSFPSPNGGCNIGAVYNYVADTWSYVDLPNVSFWAEANADTSLTYDTVGTLTYDTIGGTYYDQEGGFSRYCMFSIVADTDNDLTTKITVLDGADYGTHLALPIAAETVKPAFVERMGVDLDTEGAPLNAYKYVREVRPQIGVFSADVTLEVQLGAHLFAGGPAVFDPATTINPATQSKVNSRAGGRYLAYRLTMETANDFTFPGFDADVVLLGRR